MKRLMSLMPVAVMSSPMIAIAIIAGCEPIDDANGQRHRDENQTEERGSIRYIAGDIAANISELKYKGHEYIVYQGLKGGGLVHSESCPCKDK